MTFVGPWPLTSRSNNVFSSPDLSRKKQLFDLEVKGQGSNKGHYGTRHTSYGHAPTYQISLTSRKTKNVMARTRSNISQKPKSSPLWYFAQKTSLNLAPNWYPIICTCRFRSDSCSYISNIDISVHIYNMDNLWNFWSSCVPLINNARLVGNHLMNIHTMFGLTFVR
jgi:hypothetical protein